MEKSEVELEKSADVRAWKEIQDAKRQKSAELAAFYTKRNNHVSMIYKYVPQVQDSLYRALEAIEKEHKTEFDDDMFYACGLELFRRTKEFLKNSKTLQISDEQLIEARTRRSRNVFIEEDETGDETSED